VARLDEQKHNNRILTFEKGQVVERSHATFSADVKTACAELTAWGVKPGMRVGIRAANCYEWIVYDIALIELRAVSVAFTDDFASASVAELFSRYSLSLLLVAASGQSPAPPDFPVARLDAPNGEIRVAPGIREADEGFQRLGLIFSSGSAGRIKGMAVNRKGVEGNVDSFIKAIVPHPDDCLLLFLPISNFQQRMMYYAALWYGFDLIVTDPTHLFRSLQELHPTILIAPPVLYETIETRFSNLPAWKRWLGQIAGTLVLKIPGRSTREKLGKLIFKQAHDALGGRMRFMITGMAPTKRSTLKLFARMQLPLFETYGLIECGGVTLNLPGAHKIGSVGRPLPGVSVDLAEDGEIIASRKAAMMLGYFECAPGEAENTFIAGNRIATGDIGWFDKDGYLYITGRKKEIIISSGGEKIHPEVMEAAIDACGDVQRAVVFRAPDSPFLTAVVLPKNPQDENAKSRVRQFIESIPQDKSAMSVDNVIFTDVVFSRENGFLRPNLKLDRKKIAQHFQAHAA
jgi:long-subunit acyl-CoA synthetase (AMP-forming)